MIEEFGEYVRAKRKAMKLTLTEAVERGACSRAQLWMIENGKSVPSLRNAELICKALGIRLSSAIKTLEDRERKDGKHRPEE